jgi:hypothetical protein
MPPKKPPAKRPQPGKNKTIRTMRRRAIAQALVEQTPTTKIAKAIGISRQMVNVEIRAPETQAFIQNALAPYLDEISGLIKPALVAVKDGLGKKQITVDRLRSVKTLGYLMELAEGKKSDGQLSNRPQRFAGTMEELLILYRQTIQTGSAGTAQRPG